MPELLQIGIGQHDGHLGLGHHGAEMCIRDSLYLDHNKDGDYAIEGAIYTEMANNTDFSDPVTVLYGHNLQNGTMFSTLHYFENEDFFNEHDTLYIYTPGHALTYRVVSAYLYDDRHILNSYNLSDPAVRQAVSYTHLISKRQNKPFSGKSTILAKRIESHTLSNLRAQGVIIAATSSIEE